MEIKKELKDNVLTIALEGRLDSNTAPLLDNELTTLEGVERLTLDFAKLEYISSAGLRVLVLAQKQKYRPMEQDRKPRNKPMHLWVPYFWQRRQEYTMGQRQPLQ